MGVLIWLAQSAIVLGIFYLVAPTIVDGITQNSWAKVPAYIGLAIVAGIFMAWMKYVPFILFFLWLALTHHNLKELTSPVFEAKHGFRINKPLFYISYYAYVVVACASAWLLQITVLEGTDPNGPWVPLWQHLLRSI